MNNNKLSKFFLFMILLLSFLTSAYSINVCGVSVSTINSFMIKDNLDNNLLVADSSGNVFMQGQSHSGSVGSNGFKTGNNEFSYGISKTAFDDNSQSLSSLSSGSALIIENSAGTPVTKFFNTGYMETKGKIVAEGSQANCPNDGWGYCNADGLTRESRSYSCDITGTETGACIYGVSDTEDCSAKSSIDSDGTSFRLGGVVTDYTGCSSGNCESNTYTDYCSTDSVFDMRAIGSGISSASYNCNNLDYYDCSGNNRRFVDYTCGGSSSSGCTSSNSIVETCSTPSTGYSTWSCSDSSTAQRSVTTYAPTCSVSGSSSYCGSSSSTSTQTDNCATSDVCRSSSGCGTASFSWKQGGYGSCDVACGSGNKSQSVWCEREDGLTVSDSYCGGGKPPSSTSCSQYPSNYGNSCSKSDSCGTNSGNYVCNEAQTGTTCSVSTANFEPWNYGNSCDSSSNSCGMTNSGSITCGGSCSASTPSDSLCAPVYTGTWIKGTAPTCSTACGLSSSTKYGSVTCSNSDCDPSTKPSANSRFCSATAACILTCSGPFGNEGDTYNTDSGTNAPNGCTYSYNGYRAYVCTEGNWIQTACLVPILDNCYGTPINGPPFAGDTC
jgi:hypothetical protein